MVIHSNFSVLMKIYHLFLLVGVVAIAALVSGICRANSAPLPKWFLYFTTLPSRIEVRQYRGYRCAICRYQRILSETANQVLYHLYQYISYNEIFMTTPVEIHYSSSTLEGRETSSEIEVAQLSFLCRTTDIYPSNRLRQHSPNIKSLATPVAFSMTPSTYLMRLNAAKFRFPSN